MREAARDGKEVSGGENEAAFHWADVGFHEALAVAGGNRMLVSLFEAMGPALQRSFFLSRRGRLLRSHNSEHTVAMHQRIFERVRAGDATGAEAAMRAHLADALRDMRAAYGGELRAV